MKTSYKYLLGAVAVIGAVMLYKKYNNNEVVAPSKAKVSTDDENSGFLGFGRAVSSKNVAGMKNNCVTTCEKVNTFNGAVEVWNQECTPTQASNGFSTIVRCGGVVQAGTKSNPKYSSTLSTSRKFY